MILIHLTSAQAYFSLSPVSLLLQDGVMKRCPGRHVSASQVESDHIPAKRPVVEESAIKHDMARSGEIVGQLVRITGLA